MPWTRQLEKQTHKPHLLGWEELVDVVNMVEVLAIQWVRAGAHLG